MVKAEVKTGPQTEVEELGSQVKLRKVTDEMLHFKPEDAGDEFWFNVSQADSLSILHRIKESDLAALLVDDEISRNESALNLGMFIRLFTRDYPQYEKDPKNPDKYIETGEVFAGREMLLSFLYKGEGEESQSLSVENIGGGSGPLRLIGVNHHYGPDYSEESERRTQELQILTEDQATWILNLTTEVFDIWKANNSQASRFTTSATS